MTAPAFEGWAVVELLGHRVRYGRVTEVTLFGEAFCRIEMPTDPPTVEHYSGKALYGIREASEASIRAYHAPRRALAAGVLDGEVVDGDGDRDDDGHDDESAPQCAFCAEPLGIEPTERVDTGPDSATEVWHRRCAVEQAEVVGTAPVNDIDAEVAF